MKKLHANIISFLTFFATLNFAQFLGAYMLLTKSGLIYYFHIESGYRLQDALFRVMLILVSIAIITFLIVNAIVKAFYPISIFWYVLKNLPPGREAPFIFVIMYIVFGPFLYLMEKTGILKKENIRKPGKFEPIELTILMWGITLFLVITATAHLLWINQTNNTHMFHKIIIGIYFAFGLLLFVCGAIELYNHITGKRIGHTDDL